MLMNLVKKDLILAKKYIPILFIFAIAIPLFTEGKMNEAGGGGAVSFFLTSLFIQFLLFNTIFMLEYKFKGASYLCVTPYTRKTIVQAKYLLILLTFIVSTVIYIATSLMVPESLQLPSNNNIGITLLTITTLLGIIIPLQYKYGYEKTKYITAILIFIAPFILPSIVIFFLKYNLRLTFLESYNGIGPYLLALIIGLISMFITTQIYSKIDLE